MCDAEIVSEFFRVQAEANEAGLSMQAGHGEYLLIKSALGLHTFKTIAECAAFVRGVQAERRRGGAQ